MQKSHLPCMEQKGDPLPGPRQPVELVRRVRGRNSTVAFGANQNRLPGSANSLNTGRSQNVYQKSDKKPILKRTKGWIRCSLRELDKLSLQNRCNGSKLMVESVLKQSASPGQEKSQAAKSCGQACSNWNSTQAERGSANAQGVCWQTGWWS